MPTQVFSIQNTNDDQFVERRGAGYNVNLGFHQRTITSNPLTVERSYTASASLYIVRNALLRWYTSSLPSDAIIDSAILEVRVESTATQDNRNFWAEWYQWDGSSQSDASVSPANNAFPGSGCPITGFSSGTQQFELATPENISRTGFTHMRLHVQAPIPSGTNRVDITDFSGGSSDAAKLIVNYTVPVKEFLNVIPI